MASQRHPVLNQRAANAVSYYKGGSIGLSNSITLRSDSRARLPTTFGDVLEKKTSSPHEEDNEKWCPPCGAPTTQRPNLINMKCRYFFSFTGCTRPDCRFLHDEKPSDVVFHDGSEKTRQRSTEYIAPGPRADVKIFIGNLPPKCISSFVIDIASPFGEIKRCDVLKSKLGNGRCPAVLFMTSDAQADAAISALNAYVDPCGQRIYARKEYSRPLNEEPSVLPSRLQTLMRATQAATAQTKERVESTRQQQTIYFKAVVNPVAKDGDCLFSAIELGDKSTVREVAVDWIENHLDKHLWGGFTYRSYIEDEKKIKADVYIANMRKTGVWGGLPELYALAELSGIRLRVFAEVSPGVFKIIASEFGGDGADTRDVCLRSNHYDSLSEVWPLSKQDAAHMESTKPPSSIKQPPPTTEPPQPTKPLPTKPSPSLEPPQPTKPLPAKPPPSTEPPQPTKPLPAKPPPSTEPPQPIKPLPAKPPPSTEPVENSPPRCGGAKKSAKPALNSDSDGFCIPKKSIKVAKSLYQTFAVSSTFVTLYDLPEDWDFDADTEQDMGQCTTRTDEEVATLTPNKPPTLSTMPQLVHTASPVSTITGAWALEDATRKDRVMSSSTHELTPETLVMHGWCVLRPTEYKNA